LLDVLFPITGSIAPKQDDDNGPDLFLVVFIEDRTMRVHEIIFLPISADVKVGDILIQDTFVVDNYFVLN